MNGSGPKCRGDFPMNPSGESVKRVMARGKFGGHAVRTAVNSAGPTTFATSVLSVGEEVEYLIRQLNGMTHGMRLSGKMRSMTQLDFAEWAAIYLAGCNTERPVTLEDLTLAWESYRPSSCTKCGIEWRREDTERHCLCNRFGLDEKHAITCPRKYEVHDICPAPQVTPPKLFECNPPKLVDNGGDILLTDQAADESARAAQQER